MPTCSICLNEVRPTRANPPLRCGHVFHTSCLEAWKERGKNTCPLCRKVFDGSNFKVTVSITNNITAAANAVVLNEESVLNVLDLFDFNFDVAELDDLNSLLADLGVGLSDLDASLLDTE
jgi:hypothetical protein